MVTFSKAVFREETSVSDENRVMTINEHMGKKHFKNPSIIDWKSVPFEV